MALQAGGSESPSVRRLVACPACSLQYDASSIPPGNRFRCACGGIVKVEAAGVKEAAVVRCSSCGAPRKEKSRNCRHCGSSFTLHERDLNTICPQCVARISRRARFCHSCGIPISPQAVYGADSDWPCPVCQGTRRLATRRLEKDVSILECVGCGGLWLGHEIFALLQSRAAARQIRWLKRRDPELGRAPGTPGPMYRRCPACDRQMSRRNFERRSGVVIDVCPGDGIWMDLGEMERILGWIQDGGMARAAETERRLSKERAELKRIRLPADPLERAAAEEFGRSGPPRSFVGELVKFFIDPA